MLPPLAPYAAIGLALLMIAMFPADVSAAQPAGGQPYVGSGGLSDFAWNASRRA
ncbi:hypothetical protein AB0C14_00570 [Microbispora hainanensis]|uniref:hypothetical protein n=1 Tax=Microbispora hainanensis TaxID=568844 RepID=UPI0033D984B2